MGEAPNFLLLLQNDVIVSFFLIHSIALFHKKKYKQKEKLFFFYVLSIYAMSDFLSPLKVNIFFVLNSR